VRFEQLAHGVIEADNMVEPREDQPIEAAEHPAHQTTLDKDPAAFRYLRVAVHGPKDESRAAMEEPMN
jgi:hypothetical protein